MYARWENLGEERERERKREREREREREKCSRTPKISFFCNLGAGGYI